MKIPGILFLASFTILLSVSSCKKKDLTQPLMIGPDNNANAMVVSGYGFSNAVLNFHDGTCNGYYDTSQHKTSINIFGDTDSFTLQIHFHFNGESAFNAQDTLPGPYNASDTIIMSDQHSGKTIVYRPLYANDILNITSYDNVGGHINGIFSGTYLNNSNVHDTLKVSNGRFSILRLPDVY